MAQYYYGLGRRKESTARSRLTTNGKGIITINGHTAEEYLSNNERLLWQLKRPLGLLELADNHDVSLVISGGGHSGQVDAAVMAIAKSATELNPDWRGTLKKAGFLKRDPRMKERKKYGLRAARARYQYSKR